MVLLEAKHLSFRYATQNDFCLNDITFQIEKGEFVLLFGETGCGKSTLLKQWKPSICPSGERAGDIWYDGQLINCMEQKIEACKIGYVSQNPDNQIVTDKVWHELAFNLENIGLPADEIRRRVAEIAVFFGITSWFHQSVTQLSGGQKQILNLAAVMITRPELLLLDEPTSQLDPIGTENFMNLLSKIHTELGTTIILAEHRLEEAYAKTDRCMVMEGGKVICFDKAEIVSKFLYKNKKKSFLLLPLQARLPIRMKQEFSISTIGQAKRFIELNVTEVTRLEQKKVALKNRKDSVLSFQNVWFRYVRNGMDILHDFSLQIYKGDFLAIVGGNGQGKSTFLQLAVGIQKPYLGKVKTKERISLLSQNPQDLFLKSSVREELEMVNRDFKKVVERMGLEELLDKHPYDLSGGQQQMVGLAKVLLTNPSILLLDEPTKGVDQIRKKELGNLLRELNKEGMTIVLVSHDVDFCATYAKDAGMLFDGGMTTIGEKHSFFTEQYFFTTTCLKICRERFEGMIIEEEVLENEIF